MCIVRSHESLKSATDDISCCWLHIGSGGGAGRHGGQFSGTCNTGLPLPIFFLRSVCLSIFIFFLPSVRTLSSGFLTLLFLEKGKEPAAIEKKYSSDYQTCSQQQQQYEQLHVKILALIDYLVYVKFTMYTCMYTVTVH